MRDRNAPLGQAGVDTLAWDKMDGLVPAIVQDRASGRVLMLSYMTREALEQTRATGLVTFFSRSKQRLWTKGETSGNFLKVATVHADCDGDALLILADPQGPTCHVGAKTCFGDDALGGPGWLAELASIVANRAANGSDASYTRNLLDQGIGRIAQKVGEEGVELALAAVTREREACTEEAADLLYHLTVLMEAKDIGWDDIIAVLKGRNQELGVVSRMISTAAS